MMRRTLKQYTDLFRNPGALFKPDLGHKNNGADVILWPNGQKAIWIKSPDGTMGMEIIASTGPAGLGIQLRSFVGTAKMTVRSLKPGSVDTDYLEVTQYRQDELSQAYKAWYDADPKTRGAAPGLESEASNA